MKGNAQPCVEIILNTVLNLRSLATFSMSVLFYSKAALKLKQN